MKHKSFKMSDSFWLAVEDYRVARHYKTWSEALIELASIGIDKMTGLVPSRLGQRGGDHRSEEFRRVVERLDVELMGLPPLADDD